MDHWSSRYLQTMTKGPKYRFKLSDYWPLWPSYFVKVLLERIVGKSTAKYSKSCQIDFVNFMFIIVQSGNTRHEDTKHTWSKNICYFAYTGVARACKVPCGTTRIYPLQCSNDAAILRVISSFIAFYSDRLSLWVYKFPGSIVKYFLNLHT